MDRSREVEIQTALDEASALVARFDQVDAALGEYLIRCLLADPDEFVGSSRGSPDWFRARILEWCRTPSIRTEFGLEAVETTRMSVPQLEDKELDCYVARIVACGAAVANAEAPQLVAGPGRKELPQDGAAPRPAALVNA